MRESGLASPADRIALVSHGSEGTALGGPTTRMGQIARELAASGKDVATHADITALLREGPAPSLLHVFNSWPLKSALRTLSLARGARCPVVFSPIMLNLADRPFYDTAVKALLRDAVSDRQIEDGVRMLAEMTPLWDSSGTVAPRQGESRHFDLVRRQVAMADHVICLSQYEQALLAAIGAPIRAATIVENGVDTATMAAGDGAAFETAFGCRDFFLMVGRMEPRKNQALAAFALKDLDVPIVCIGHVGDADYYALLKRWAGPRLIHIERINDRVLLAGAYKAARAVILPSWSEGAPLVALEAAAAGTPLILSRTSSEQSYFGEWADYVHPCDLDGLRQAAEAQIRNPDSPARRQARSDMAGERFSIARHVSNTLEVYAKLARHEAPASTDAVFLDATYLAHQTRHGTPLTGVAQVELQLGKAVLAERKDARVLAWSSPARQHFAAEASDFGTEAFGAHATRLAEDSAYDILCEPAALRISPLSSRTLRQSEARTPGLGRRAFTLFKHALNALPGGLHDTAVRTLQRVKPGFSPVVLPEHYLSASARLGPHRPRTGDVSLGQVRLSVRMRPEPRTRLPDLEEGARLILLGHPWISNEAYLDDLTELVGRGRLRLWVHIPDILYVTRPGTFDAETSALYRRRLERILQIADTVITISAQSEREIAAFAAERGLARPVCRIVPGVTVQAGADGMPGACASAHVEAGGRMVVYVASMSERKRHAMLIESWQALRARSPAAREARLVLVGRPLKGYETFTDPARLAELRADNIHVAGGCTDADVAALYRAAAFSVYPSVAEGWGLPPLESLMAGTPCLVTAGLPVAEAITHDALKCLPADDAEAWTAAMAEWLDNKQALQRAADAAGAFTPPTWDAAARLILPG